MSSATFFTFVAFLDDLLPIDSAQLQLVGEACLSIAAKLIDQIGDFSLNGGDEEFQVAECQAANAIRFRLRFMTAFHDLRYFLTLSNCCCEIEANFAQYLLEMALVRFSDFLFRN
jgi:hypothetical protein